MLKGRNEGAEAFRPYRVRPCRDTNGAKVSAAGFPRAIHDTRSILENFPLVGLLFIPDARPFARVALF